MNQSQSARVLHPRDVIAHFIRDRLHMKPDADLMLNADLRAELHRYCAKIGQRPPGAKGISAALKRAGWIQHPNRMHGRFWIGITFKD